MRTKFNVNKNKDKRTYEGIIFDSELEMRYYRDVVCPKVESGEIVSFELQKPYILQEDFVHNDKSVKEIKYVADFFLVYSDGREELIDTKGFPDNSARLKRKLFWYKYPDVDYKWICYSKIDGGWCDFDYVQEQRSKRKAEKLKKLNE